MTSDIDYGSVELPDGEPSPDWHYTARRAWLLQEIERRGTPAAINQSQTAARFGTCQSNIANDLDVLAEYIAAHAGGDRATATAASVYQAAVRELLAADEWKAAAKVTSEWMGWLQDTGRQETAPARHEIDADIRTQATDAAYRVVEAGPSSTDAETGDTLASSPPPTAFTAVPDSAPAEVDTDE